MSEAVYVVVYVGYEGIESILLATTNPEEASAKVLRTRQRVEETAALSEEALLALPYPDCCWTEVDRVCVMMQWLKDEPFRCCCTLLGVAPERQVLY